jgi:hypothetical protein
MTYFNSENYSCRNFTFVLILRALGPFFSTSYVVP